MVTRRYITSGFALVVVLSVLFFVGACSQKSRNYLDIIDRTGVLSAATYRIKLSVFGAFGH